ncbi:Os07g0193900 [Oryza sativa Japonica Group]|uniref:Os07g0193900 protein n=1 Tax=Oryza sativa subsp. japonica TaxID=39947 RepID=A0A0P0X3G4_ORYSJ|nr:Os07g0193900 [Oryza sativa Japonica Group]
MATSASALTSLSTTEMRRAARQEGAADLRRAMVSAFTASSRGSATTASARSAAERERPDPSPQPSPSPDPPPQHSPSPDPPLLSPDGGAGRRRSSPRRAGRQRAGRGAGDSAGRRRSSAGKRLGRGEHAELREWAARLGERTATRRAGEGASPIGDSAGTSMRSFTGGDSAEEQRAE